MKLGLHSATYSGFFSSGKALTLDEIIRKAAQFGFDAIEILGRSPHGNPLHNHASLVHSYRRALEMIDKVGSPAWKARIDPHCLWQEGTVDYSGHELEQAIRHMRELVPDRAP